MLAVLCALLVAVSVLALSVGATRVPFARVAATLASLFAGGPAAAGGDGLIILQVRLPRLLLGLLIGAALASCGALMQGLFRNPLADPGLVGVSAGAALAAAATITLGRRAFRSAPLQRLARRGILRRLDHHSGDFTALQREADAPPLPTMLLAGVAFGAMAGAGMGLFSYIADDRQLRDLAFWSLGSLGGASWTKVTTVAPFLAPMLLAAPFLARGLNAIALGEAEAYHVGVPVQRLKALAIFLVAVAVGASVACAGMIGFVGIVVPHVLRLIAGPDHRFILPASALLGAAFLILADTIARVIVAPAELPIGILTAAIGAPFFLWLLLRGQGGVL